MKKPYVFSLFDGFQWLAALKFEALHFFLLYQFSGSEVLSQCIWMKFSCGLISAVVKKVQEKIAKCLGFYLHCE